MLRIGDWVTQYSSGYWMIVNILPKYADQDYHTENREYKFGDQIGEWVLMKKGFTSKMKFRLDSDYCDSAWCKKVTPEELQEIEDFFHNNPALRDKFYKYEFKERPAVSTLWINLTSTEEQELNNLIANLPIRFTSDLFLEELKKRNLSRIISRPPTTHILTFSCTLWELDEQKRQLFKDPVVQTCTI